MTTFALVHGAWHGAWCWERLTPLLRQEGHNVVAMDLPCDDASASFEAYADVVCAALDGCNDDVVLVGHSLGANTIPLVAARRPVRHLVYLCGAVPAIGRSVIDQIAGTDMMGQGWDAGLGEPDAQQRTTWVDPDCARALLFADCDEPTAEAAFTRLRPQARYPSTLPFSLSEFPAVGHTTVICSDDRMVNPAWSRRVARERLGANVVDLPGSHSPFFSRPSTLAGVLLRLAEAQLVTLG
ncbi:alpha/beta fold hydrolase [Mycolicibacterium neworleansense]|nr:alpha/beta fold hydrolase [Mycolicibacterium neworleansense]MCV7360127.1 alpha/beta fold hydrolase [Mycolicibacterium neworleansense]